MVASAGWPVDVGTQHDAILHPCRLISNLLDIKTLSASYQHRPVTKWLRPSDLDVLPRPREHAWSVQIALPPQGTPSG